ncbi:hypothetical protein WAI453_000829 [Rhynchosporium graminicola]
MFAQAKGILSHVLHRRTLIPASIAPRKTTDLLTISVTRNLLFARSFLSTREFKHTPQDSAPEGGTADSV